MVKERSIEDLKTCRSSLNEELDESIRCKNFPKIEQKLADIERIDEELNYRKLHQI